LAAAGGLRRREDGASDARIRRALPLGSSGVFASARLLGVVFVSRPHAWFVTDAVRPCLLDEGVRPA